MIRYSLTCANNHGFESWFPSADGFDRLKVAGMLTCPACGDTDVSKSLMAPRVRPGRANVPIPAEAANAPQQVMSNAPDPRMVEALKSLREHVEKTSDYVGPNFASEARAMHDGDMPHRPIYGEANEVEAKKLAEDGVPALPLPFIPKQKTN